MRQLSAPLSVALCASLTVSVAPAQDLLVCRHSPAAVALYSGADGSLINPTLIDVDALLGLGGVSSFIWDVKRAPNGELWVSNFSNQTVQRFSSDGSMYLGDIATSAGNTTGLDLDGGTLAIASSGLPGGAFEYDIATMVETQVSTTSGSWDVTSLGGQWLVGRNNGTVVSIDPTNGIEIPWGDPGGFCEQVTVVPASGQVLVANFDLRGYSVHDASGTLLQTFTPAGVGSIRGVAPLGNGNVLLSGVSGVFIFDPVADTVVQLASGSGAFIEGGGDAAGVGVSYCMANVNSTGVVGEIAATGSSLVSANSVTLQAGQLPPNAFGFFLVSRQQGVTPNPAGSAGNLCLGGVIGRYVGPGEIQQADSQGTFSLAIDLANVPQPQGFEAVQPGEVWNFQAWHRDSSAGQPTSNFTPGLEIAFQ